MIEIFEITAFVSRTLAYSCNLSHIPIALKILLGITLFRRFLGYSGRISLIRRYILKYCKIRKYCRILSIYTKLV